MKNKAETEQALYMDLSVLDGLLHIDFSELDQALNIPTEQAGNKRRSYTRADMLQRFRDGAEQLKQITESGNSWSTGDLKQIRQSKPAEVLTERPPVGKNNKQTAQLRYFTINFSDLYKKRDKKAEAVQTKNEKNEPIKKATQKMNLQSLQSQ